MSHVNYIKICLLKTLGAMNVEQMQIYTPMSLMRSNHRRYSERSLQKSNTLLCRSEVSLEWTVTFCLCVISYQIGNTQAACQTEGTSMLVHLGPDHEINLRGAPYELVPVSFVNSLLVLQRRLRRACAFVQSLLTNIEFEVD